MAKLTKDYCESLREDLRDPQEAIAYLQAALDEGDRRCFLLALLNVATAQDFILVLARPGLEAMTDLQLQALASGADPEVVRAMHKA